MQGTVLGSESRGQVMMGGPKVQREESPGHQPSHARVSPRTLPHGTEGGGAVFLLRMFYNIHPVVR